MFFYARVSAFTGTFRDPREMIIFAASICPFCLTSRHGRRQSLTFPSCVVMIPFEAQLGMCVEAMVLGRIRRSAFGLSFISLGAPGVVDTKDILIGAGKCSGPENSFHWCLSRVVAKYLHTSVAACSGAMSGCLRK